MKKTICAMLMLAILMCGFGEAEDIWVQETWHRVQDTLDCDGVPLRIDARVMDVEPGATAREYHLSRISNSYAKRAVQTMINWQKLGFSPREEGWLEDTGYYQTDLSVRAGVYTMCEMNGSRKNDPALKNGKYYCLYTMDTTDEMDFTPLPGLEYERVAEYAALAAGELGYRLGEPQYMKRMDKETIRQDMLFWRDVMPDECNLSEDEMEALQCFVVEYPVYYRGLRLFSGHPPGMPGESFLLPMSLRVMMGNEGVVSLEAPYFEAFEPKGEEKPIITGDMALQKMREAYADMFLGNITSMLVKEVSFAYCAISGDATAKRGFTLYPVWWISVEEIDSCYSFVTAHGFHAITGRKLF